MRLYIASENEGKVAEIRGIFRRIFPNCECVTSADLGIKVDYPEEGGDYWENSAAKARAAVLATGLLSIADDSGLEVDALGGGPGVISARYGDNDKARVARLLTELEGVDDRRCRFRAVASAALLGGHVISREGVWEGEITKSPAGRGGFGYDPVFFDRATEKTAAEMTSEEKTRLSHRGRAFRALAEELRRSLAKRST